MVSTRDELVASVLVVESDSSTLDSSLEARSGVEDVGAVLDDSLDIERGTDADCSLMDPTRPSPFTKKPYSPPRVMPASRTC